MVKRTASRGPRTGKDFYGCSKWSANKCPGIINIDEDTENPPVGPPPPVGAQNPPAPPTSKPPTQPNQPLPNNPPPNRAPVGAGAALPPGADLGPPRRIRAHPLISPQWNSFILESMAVPRNALIPIAEKEVTGSSRGAMTLYVYFGS